MHLCFPALDVQQRWCGLESFFISFSASVIWRTGGEDVTSTFDDGMGEAEIEKGGDVSDMGCGVTWNFISLALLFPRVRMLMKVIFVLWY
jgi:hypothetical protein